MKESIRGIVLSKHDTLRKAVRVADEHPRYGMAVVVEEGGELFGILTSGDIYKAIFSGASLDAEVGSLANKHPVILTIDDLNDRAVIRERITQLFERKGHCFPIVDSKFVLVDVVHYTQLEDRPVGLSGEGAGRKRILVIGGGGYLGTSLISMLLQSGYLVRVLDNFTHRNFVLYNLPNQDNLEIIRDDIRDLRPVVKALEDVQAVVLLAAVVGDPAGKNNPRQTIEINYLASKMIADASKYACIGRFIFASTCSVYGVGADVLDETASLKPVSHYAKTKIAAEKAIFSLGNDEFFPTVLRFATLYGLSPRMRFDLVVNLFSLKIVRERSIEIFGGKQWRPLLHVKDAADAIIKVLESPKEAIANQVFNVGSEEQNIRIQTLGDIVKSSFPSVDVHVRVSDEDARDYRVSFQKIKSILAFQPQRTIEKAIQEMIEFVRSLPDENLTSEKYCNHGLEY